MIGPSWLSEGEEEEKGEGEGAAVAGNPTQPVRLATDLPSKELSDAELAKILADLDSI